MTIISSRDGGFALSFSGMGKSRGNAINAICENNILPKIPEFTVLCFSIFL